jgi:hypothetical protein
MVFGLFLVGGLVVQESGQAGVSGPAEADSILLSALLGLYGLLGLVTVHVLLRSAVR